MSDVRRVVIDLSEPRRPRKRELPVGKVVKAPRHHAHRTPVKRFEHVVHRMTGQGHDARQIAKRIGRPLDEIKSIIARGPT